MDYSNRRVTDGLQSKTGIIYTNIVVVGISLLQLNNRDILYVI